MPPRRSDKFEWPSRTSQQNETNQTGASSTKKDSFAFKMRSKQAKAFYGEKSRKVQIYISSMYAYSAIL